MTTATCFSDTHIYERIESIARQSPKQRLPMVLLANVPPKSEVYRFVDQIFDFFFPTDYRQLPKAAARYEGLMDQFCGLIEPLAVDSDYITEAFFLSLPTLLDMLLEDANEVLSSDPAATSLEEVIISYPGFYATAVYRLAHELTRLEVPLLPRIMSEYAHSKTGIDIHPAAQIGRAFVIDHGTGTVIGATAHIGNYVKLYHGVTLGALQVKKSLANSKRHPTIEDHVTIYANATVLGGKTTIGHHSILGGNAWVTRSVPAHSRVYYKTRASQK